MSKSELGGHFVVGPPHFVRSLGGAPQYREFPGVRPPSEYKGLSPAECKEQGGVYVQDIRGFDYCRGGPGSVSARYPPRTSVYFEPEWAPEYAHGGEACFNPDHESPGACAADPECDWVADETGRQYCRGKGAHELSESQAILSQLGLVGGRGGYQLEPRRASSPLASKGLGRGIGGGKIELPVEFQPSGRFNPGRFSQEEKESWFDKRVLPSEAERKYCRCEITTAANNIYRYGTLRINPYAVCSASVGRGSPKLRSQLSVMSTTGGCTKGARFENWPTSLLYAYAVMRRHHPEFAKLPPLTAFLSNMDAWRPRLLRAAFDYRQKEAEKLGYPPGHVPAEVRAWPTTRRPSPRSASPRRRSPKARASPRHR